MIPKHAKKVFQGKIFSIFQWKQKMFDGSFKTFEKAKRLDTVVILATLKDKMVILKQKQPGTKWFYCTPSGRMDVPGEKPVLAAKRELLEETGMTAKKFFLWKKIESKSKVESTIYFFIARDCKVVAKQNLDNGEKIKVELLSFEDYLKLSENPESHMELSQTDMFKARLDKNYKKYLKKTLFG